MITLLSGGTGTPKLLQGLKNLIPEEDISVVVNTGEDVEVSGLRVSPDLDTVIYTLAGIIDDENWYGIEGDSFCLHRMLSRLGHDEILRIGDKDRAVQLYRTFRMSEGASLSEVTEEICDSLGVKAKVIPMSDDRVKSKIVTEGETISFHEFWVTRRGKVNVKDVVFVDSDKAEPAPGVLEALGDSDHIVIGPSNPVTSLGPILSVKRIKSFLKGCKDKVVAISPLLADKPVSGPAGVLMKGLGYEVSPVSVANIYKDFVDSFFIHDEDKDLKPEIESLGLNVFVTDILMPDLSSRVNLSKKLLDFLDYRK